MEYWEEKALMSIARTVGRPVQVDENTLKAKTRYYASMLTKIDLAKPIPSKSFVEGEGEGFMQKVVLGHLPKFCNNCKVIDHMVYECRNLSMMREEEENKNEQREGGTSETGSNLEEGVKEGVCSPTSFGIDVPPAQCSIPPDTLAIIPVVAETWADLANLDKEDGLSKEEEFDSHKVDDGFDRGIGNPKSKNTLKKLVEEGCTKPVVLSSSDQQVMVWSEDVMLMFIHANCDIARRRALGRDLAIINGIKAPWLVRGNFYAILSSTKKKGGVPSSNTAILDFQNYVDALELIQCTRKGHNFTWHINEEIEVMHRDLEHDASNDDLSVKLTVLNTSFNKARPDQEILWKQKSRPHSSLIYGQYYGIRERHYTRFEGYWEVVSEISSVFWADGRDIDIWRNCWGPCPSIKDTLPLLKDWKSTKNFLSKMIVNGTWVVNESLAPVLQQSLSFSSYLRDLWFGGMWGTCLTIWKARNACIFDNVKWNEQTMKMRIMSTIQDAATLSVGCMHNCTFDLQIIAKLGFLSKVRKPSKVRSMYWSLPELGEVKINSDGAALGNPGKGGAGAVFRASDGEVVGVISVGLPILTSFIAECSAIIESLEHCSCMGWEISWVEGDSVATIQAFSNDAIPWVLDARWKNVRKKIRRI
ncbi:hypothetical protein GIB67_034153 [Kingdonia uniflora]|uniref:RNase H type-1 domain-containing protein n=1 Tax=Kingdonia uniflora TaxID=39325 RepID=A0A7J7P4K7_9MAGN|nr:hypothetical protein GIB67_034153 [Kingdonia uniflora]